MQIEIEGESPLSEKKLRSMLSYAQRVILLPDSMFLSLTFESDLEYSGACSIVDEEEDWLNVEINSDISFKEFTLTLFHELVHCKQIIDKRYVPGPPNMWEGQVYRNHDFYSPWELEAYAMESKLAEGYLIGGRL